MLKNYQDTKAFFKEFTATLGIMVSKEMESFKMNYEGTSFHK